MSISIPKSAVTVLLVVAWLTGSVSPASAQNPTIRPGYPANGADNIPGSPVLAVQVVDPQANNLTVTFHGRPVAGPDFTIIAVPDTQFYVSRLHGGLPEMFTKQTDWIVSNRTNRNIAFVTQLGDCVEHGDNGGTNTEWLNATNALYRLEDPLKTQLPAGIPYGVAVGNHDQTPITDPNGTTTFYNQFLGTNHFAGRPYYGGHYGTNNDNHYELFSASGIDFIAVHLEYDARVTNTDVIAWADKVLKENRNRRAIVVSHWLLNAGFNASFSAQGRAVYNALKANTNLFLMLCGHVTPVEGQRQDTFAGNSVWTLMSDYQSRTNGGNGWLRIYTFSPSNNVMRVQTYSPWLDQFETDADSQFDVPFQMTPPSESVVIGNPSSMRSGATATAEWANLPIGGTFEWFVKISDGTNEVTSPTWRFTTGKPVGDHHH